MTLLVNPRRRHGGSPPPTPASRAFHRRLPGYAPTPVIELDRDVASRLGVGRVLLKDERSRFGLPAFKILGASWATYRVLVDRLGTEPDWVGLDDLAVAVKPLLPLGLATATDGNHGRAVARMAAMLGMKCLVFVPAGTAPARVEAIENEGAAVEVIDGTYDDAVAISAGLDPDAWQVVSDTSWDGYERVPGWVIDGYATIVHELDTQLEQPPAAVVVPLGVGALGGAVAAHYDRAPGEDPWLLGVEPDDAGCVMAGVEAGHVVEVPGPHTSIMAGLNCGRASQLALPVISDRYDAFVKISDEACEDALRTLAGLGIDCGECGAAALAGYAAAVESSPVRDDGTIVLLCTEGVTDPVGFERIVGRPPI